MGFLAVFSRSNPLKTVVFSALADEKRVFRMQEPATWQGGCYDF
jgi:hypothetical protein